MYKRSAVNGGVCKTCQLTLEVTPKGSPFQQFELEQRGYCSVGCKAGVHALKSGR